jgi:hypothetical protein
MICGEEFMVLHAQPGFISLCHVMLGDNGDVCGMGGAVQ